MSDRRDFLLDARAVEGWQARLEATCSLGSESLLEAFIRLRQLLEEVTRSLVSSEPQSFTTLFERLVFVEEQSGIPRILCGDIQRFRKNSNKAVHESASELRQADLLSGARAIREYLEFFSTPRALSPPSVRSEPEPAFPDPTAPGGQLAVAEPSTRYRPEDTVRETPKPRLPSDPTRAESPDEVLVRIRAIVTAVADVEERMRLDGSRYRRRRIECRSEDIAADAFTVVLMHEWADTPVERFNVVNLIRLVQVSEQMYRAEGDSLVVLQPDLLYQPTEIADCFQIKGANPLLFLPGRFMQDQLSAPMLKGIVAGEIFSERLKPSGKNFNEVFAGAMRKQGLACAQLEEKDIADIRQDLKSQARTMMAVIESLQVADEDSLSLEPTFLAPDVGLMGRPDALISDPVMGYRTIELKSGKAPDGTVQSVFAGLPISSPAWPNNLAQAGCYAMLLAEFAPDAACQTNILYSNAASDPLRNLTISATVQKAIMLVRSQLVASEMSLAAGRMDVLDEIRSECFGGCPPYVLKKVERFRATRAALEPLHKSYFDEYTAFVMREYMVARCGGTTGDGGKGGSGLASLWRDSVLERSRRFACLSDLKALEAPQGEAALSLPNGEAGDFREGDIVVLHQPIQEGLKSTRGLQLWKGVIRKLDQATGRLEVKLFNAYAKLETVGMWLLDHDFMDSSFRSQWASLQYFAESSLERRRMLLGEAPPAMRTLPDLRGFQWNTKPTPKQLKLLEKCLAADDYFLLQGPPGTGKTSTMLKGLVQHLTQETGEKLLVLAFTNRAVDEICSKLKDVCEYIRFGSSDRVEKAQSASYFDQLASQLTHTEILERIAETRVVITTVSTCALRPELFDLWNFTTAIVDEASQLLEPQVIGILARVPRFILIGDEKQLPAVTVQPKTQSQTRSQSLQEAGMQELSDSLFSRLLNRCKDKGWEHAFGMLEEQGRMHKDIEAFPSTRFYEGKLKRLRSVEDETGLFLSGTSDPLEGALARHRVVLIPSPPPTRGAEVGSDELGRTHIEEAKRVARILQTVRKAYSRKGRNFKPDASVGVVTPFRAQVAEIRRQIAELGDDEELRHVTVDTVERFQGGERDVMVMSLVVQRPEQLSLIQSLTSDCLVDRKLNVALTRAKEHLIILANVATLRDEPGSEPSKCHYAALVEHLEGLDAVIEFPA
jgi:DNA replication ATP-dependent helicase Dna2